MRAVRLASLLIAGLAVLFFTGLPARADGPALHGVALVIGQSDYASLPKLANPPNDARAIDQLLDQLGFDVTRVLDGDGAKLKQKISRFIEDAADADVAIVYYSGHGIEAGGEDYLVPVDADLSTPQRAGETLLPVSGLLNQLAKAVPITIVLLDACRTGAFPAGTMIEPPGTSAPVAASETGLGVLRGPAPVAKANVPPTDLGMIVGFAASPGEPALDGAPGDANSPYAAALLKHLAAGGYSFGDVMTMVSEEVYLNTHAQQLPWVNSSLRKVLSFGQPAAAADPDQAAITDGRRKLLLSIADTPPATQKYVEQLAGQDHVPLDGLYGMLDALGVKASPDDGDLQQQLQKGADKLKELIADHPPPVSSDNELARLGKLADEAQGQGAMALALKYRDAASERADDLLSDKQKEAAQLKQDMIDIGNTYAANAATASLNFDHLKAAALYGKAFEAVKDWDKGLAVTFKIGQGDALTDQGYYLGDNGALADALAAYTDAEALAPKDTDAEDWGRLRDRTGAAEALLGSHLGDAAALKQAIGSFNEALSVETRDGSPDRWAATQNNLGNVLYDLGRQTDDIDLLQQSVAAFDAALEVYTRDANPARWATVESNRGGSQTELAQAIYAATGHVQTAAIQAGNTDVEHIPEVAAAIAKAEGIVGDAITSLEAAVASRSRTDSPLDWAMIEHALGAAYQERGRLTNSAADFGAAVSAFRSVLEVHDPVRTPVQWSISAGNLAATLRLYASVSKTAAPLSEATDLLERAIALTPQAQSPGDWSELQIKLGNVWSDRVDYDHDPASVDQAVAAYRAAEQVVTPQSDLSTWGDTELNIVSTLLKTAVPGDDVPRLEEARDTATTALQVLTAGNDPDASIFGNLLPTLNQMIDALTGKS